MAGCGGGGGRGRRTMHVTTPTKLQDIHLASPITLQTFWFDSSWHAQVMGRFSQSPTQKILLFPCRADAISETRPGNRHSPTVPDRDSSKIHNRLQSNLPCTVISYSINSYIPLQSSPPQTNPISTSPSCFEIRNAHANSIPIS